MVSDRPLAGDMAVPPMPTSWTGPSTSMTGSKAFRCRVDVSKLWNIIPNVISIILNYYVPSMLKYKYKAIILKSC